MRPNGVKTGTGAVDPRPGLLFPPNTQRADILIQPLDDLQFPCLVRTHARCATGVLDLIYANQHPWEFHPTLPQRP